MENQNQNQNQIHIQKRIFQPKIIIILFFLMAKIYIKTRDEKSESELDTYKLS